MWAVSPPIKEPQAIESLMLAFGKALHLACEFENKCQYVLRVFNISEMFRTTGDAQATFAAAVAAKDRLLAKTIMGLEKTSYVTVDEVEVLTRARFKRNYVVHECSRLGPTNWLQYKNIADGFRALRPAVINLAKGDNVVSVWSLAIQEKVAAPEWMTRNYEARVLNWIFGDPFSGPSSWDEWALAQLSDRPLPSGD
jgi:hypothetical protein